MTEQQFRTYQEQTFDAFCKAVIRNESINIHRQLAAQADKEIQLSALSEQEMGTLCTEDSYSLYCRTYFVKGIPINVFDQTLGDVLQYLTPQRRDVILLYFFLGYSDSEIACILHISNTTVKGRRNAALRRLRELLEEMKNV